MRRLQNFSTAIQTILDWPRRTACDEVLCNEAFHIAKIPKYDRYLCWLAWMVLLQVQIKSAIKYLIMSNQQLVQKLHNYYKIWLL